MPDITDEDRERAEELLGRTMFAYPLDWKAVARQMVALALAEQRERDAKIADTASHEVDGGEYYIAAKIAAAIRKGK